MFTTSLLYYWINIGDVDEKLHLMGHLIFHLKQEICALKYENESLKLSLAAFKEDGMHIACGH